MTENQTGSPKEKEESFTDNIYSTLGNAGEKLKSAFSGVSQKAVDMNAKIQEAAAEAKISQEESQSGGFLVSKISDLANTLISKELELAKLKLQQMVKKFAIGGVLIAIAAVMAIFMLDMLLLAGATGFATIWLPQLKALCFGALIISGILLILVLLLLLIGNASIKKAKRISPNPAPGLKESVSAIKKGIKK